MFCQILFGLFRVRSRYKLRRFLTSAFPYICMTTLVSTHFRSTKNLEVFARDIAFEIALNVYRINRFLQFSEISPTVHLLWTREPSNFQYKICVQFHLTVECTWFFSLEFIVFEFFSGCSCLLFAGFSLHIAVRLLALVHLNILFSNSF